MTPLSNFVYAHYRHRADAHLLLQNSRLPNADQLFGFSAECGLKAMMKAFGMPVEPTTDTPEKPEQIRQIQEIWPTFSTLAKGPVGARYLGMLSSGDPFANWSHHDRYADRFKFQKIFVRLHRDAARQVRKMVHRAQKDGML